MLRVRVNLCRLWWSDRHSLTGVAPPIYSATESGGRSFAAVNDRQTGNSGAIPGRPRRCIRAIPCRACQLREECEPRRGDRPADFRAIVDEQQSLPRPREGDSRSSTRVRRPTSVRKERVPTARAVSRARPACAGCWIAKDIGLSAHSPGQGSPRSYSGGRAAHRKRAERPHGGCHAGMQWTSGRCCAPDRFLAGRTARRDFDHRSARRAAPAGRAGGEGSRPGHDMCQQPPPGGDGTAQLRQRQQWKAAPVEGR